MRIIVLPRFTHAGRHAVPLRQQPVALHAPKPLGFDVDEQRLTLGELFDTARDLGELGRYGHRVGDNRHDFAGGRDELKAPAADDRLVPEPFARR